LYIADDEEYATQANNFSAIGNNINATYQMVLDKSGPEQKSSLFLNQINGGNVQSAFSAEVGNSKFASLAASILSEVSAGIQTKKDDIEVELDVRPDVGVKFRHHKQGGDPNQE